MTSIQQSNNEHTIIVYNVLYNAWLYTYKLAEKLLCSQILVS